ncbi:unnamed protein product [Paramecium sonneborni]|uniref:Uncharacterized protein n=1 Tax=Paramecium sonneborni TaxID=65129 RepID=A0A8S1KXT8_9CILI|nr:unnamed protein product [Paramecium sonneborni]
MSITVEELATNIETVLASLGDEKMVNWEVVEQTETNLMKHFDQLFERLYTLKDSLQRVFLINIKNLRQYDAKDLAQKVKDKKLEPVVLKSLTQYAFKNEKDEILLNPSLIKGQVNSIVLPWVGNNLSVTDKIKETNEWLDQKLAELEVFKPKESSEQAKTQEIQPKNEENDKSNYTFKSDKLNEIASQIQIMHIPSTNNMISIKTYTQIVEGSVDLAEPEFIRITLENRKARRDVLYSDGAKYVQLLLDYVNDIENLLMKAQEEICKKIDISQQTLEQSEMLLMERGLGQHVFMLQAQARQRIKDKLPKQKQVQMNATKEIIRYQIKLLNEKQDFLKNMIDKLPTTYESGQLVPMVLNLVMGDMIFEEHSYEEEDYISNLENPQLFQDPDMMELLKSIETGVVNLLGKTAFAQPPQGMMGNIPPQMLQRQQQQ